MDTATSVFWSWVSPTGSRLAGDGPDVRMAEEGYDQGDDSAADAALGLTERVIHKRRLCMIREGRLRQRLRVMYFRDAPRTRYSGRMNICS